VLPDQSPQHSREQGKGTRTANSDQRSTDDFVSINVPGQTLPTPVDNMDFEMTGLVSHEDLILPMGPDISTFLDDLNDFVFDGVDGLGVYDHDTTAHTSADNLQQTIPTDGELPETHPKLHSQQDSAQFNPASMSLASKIPALSHTMAEQIGSASAPGVSFSADMNQSHEQISSSLSGNNTTPNFFGGTSDRPDFHVTQGNEKPPEVSGRASIAQKPVRPLPRLRENSPSSTPHLTLDKDVFAVLSKDLACRLDSDDRVKQLPNAFLCQSFLSSYIESFDLHLPMIHWPTLDIGSTPSPLIFSMCSIGALYRLDRRRARALYDLSLRGFTTVGSYYTCYNTTAYEIPH
jgi:hypothetical protein